MTELAVAFLVLFGLAVLAPTREGNAVMGSLAGLVALALAIWVIVA